MVAIFMRRCGDGIDGGRTREEGGGKGKADEGGGMKEVCKEMVNLNIWIC